jgi:hypothetical protein
MIQKLVNRFKRMPYFRMTGMVSQIVKHHDSGKVASSGDTLARRKIWKAEVKNIPAMIAATIKSGHAVAVPPTPSAANITATLPMASLREHSQTDLTFASLRRVLSPRRSNPYYADGLVRV